MTKRNKRLKRGIDSIDETILEHEARRIDALEKKDEYLANYLKKEIEALIERRKNRNEKIHRKS